MTFSGSVRGLALASLVALAVSACSESSSAAGQSLPGPASNPDQVVAEVAGRSITLKEVDDPTEENGEIDASRAHKPKY